VEGRQGGTPILRSRWPPGVSPRSLCSGQASLSRHLEEGRKLKALEDENRELKKLLAETMLDASTLKEMLGKNF
jgi:hypothetical protein